jgi:hypothetical protein
LRSSLGLFRKKRTPRDKPAKPVLDATTALPIATAIIAEPEPISFPRRSSSSQPPEEKQNMRLILPLAVIAATISTAAVAQSANRDANTPAVNTPNAPPNPGAPVAGANSFTEGQAKSRIESSGYANVSELRKDDQGVWRGKAVKDGKAVIVSLDFQGNVTAR